MAKVIKKKIRGIKALINEGKELDYRIKTANERLKEIKAMIRQHAAFTKKKQIDGVAKSCVFIEHTKVNEIDPDDYFKWAVDNDRMDDFMDSVKVQIGLARKVLDEEFESMTKTKTNKWNRVTFGEIL